MNLEGGNSKVFAVNVVTDISSESFDYRFVAKNCFFYCQISWVCTNQCRLRT